jgi:membrane-associated phospholipid phosphatase
MIAPVGKWCALLLLGASSVLAQTPSPDQNPPQTNQSGSGNDIPAQTPKVAVEPPQGALKTLIINTAKDQKAIWTSPFHMNRQNAKWWIACTVVTAGLIASDRTTSKWLPDSQHMVNVSNNFSQIGEAYVLYPAVGVTYLIGVLNDNPKTKEVGLLGAEALTDSVILSSVLKAITGRERPNLTNGNGNWFQFGNYSFPSGHSIMMFTFASVISHEYHTHKIVPIVAYSLASAVSFARFTGRDHFLSDIFVGGAMGYFVGGYVYHHHADEAIHHKPLSRLQPDRIGPYVNPKTASVGVGLSWDLISQ